MTQEAIFSYLCAFAPSSLILKYDNVIRKSDKPIIDLECLRGKAGLISLLTNMLQMGKVVTVCFCFCFFKVSLSISAFS